METLRKHMTQQQQELHAAKAQLEANQQQQQSNQQQFEEDKMPRFNDTEARRLQRTVIQASLVSHQY